MFRFFLSTLVRKFENPKINGTEGVYVNLVEKYYLSKQATWIDDYTLNSIKQKSSTMKPLLLGKVFPDMELKTPEDKAFKISELEAKYTVVFFYSPTCSHCIATMPKVKKFYESYKERGVKVLAISVRESGTVWKDFIANQGISDFINGWEAKDEGFYYYKYDVTIFPTVYVLNEKKQIIGRKLAGEELGNFIDYTEGK
jgi:peroxiredoxin